MRAGLWSLVLAFLVLPVVTFGQTVKGIVYDDQGKAIIANVVVIETGQGQYTNKFGFYKLRLPSDTTLTLSFSAIGYAKKKFPVKLEKGETLKLDVVLPFTADTIQDVNIQAEKAREQAGTLELDPEVTNIIPSPNRDISGILLSQGIGVTSIGGELSSSYSVRGGSFDENLVYVNGFEVYRPYLVRSGQQEGLSFPNPDLISGINFSAGGFQARYGDKMSSVLDVTYKKPDDWAGSASISLLGTSAHLEGASKDTSFTMLFGFRQKANRYLLNALETQGQYFPSFIDVQSYLTWQVSDRIGLEWIANYSRNKFEFVPVSRESTFGVVNQVLQLDMFFEGSESDRYRSFMTGFAVNYDVSKKTQFRFFGSYYRSQEREAFDIIGDYFIGEVETDFSQENFGQVRFGLGTGSIHNNARNFLESDIYHAGWRGSSYQKNNIMQWGLEYKREIISDELKEWDRVDSAGFSLPYSSDDVLIDRYLRSSFDLKSNRFSGYFQNTFKFSDTSRVGLTAGVRFQYWDVNQEFAVNPRLQFFYKPNLKKDFVFTAAAGLYYQPPFYREMRNLDGVVNTQLASQKSAHFVVGLDYNFKAWGRPFKIVTEAYYKHMWDLVPYELENVLIRYFGENKSKGFATGLDFRLNGELVKGVESWLSMSVMTTKENIEGDFFYRYFDAEGNEVFRGQVRPDQIADSQRVEPGYLPRPTDQRISFNLFFQDYLPKNDDFKVHLNLVFATGLPFGPPDSKRYNDLLRIPPYRRVDIGFSAQLYDRERRIEKIGAPSGFFAGFKSVWATLEVYNIFGIENTVSYLWVKDFRNTVYAVPNALTNRLINARVIFEFN